MTDNKEQKKIKSEKNILNFTLANWEEWFVAQKEPKFRAAQIIKWIYVEHNLEPLKYTDMSRSLREKLVEEFDWSVPIVDSALKSKDGSTKLLLKTASGEYFESVIMPSEGRTTLCISCQIGCKMGCRFCQTGKMGLTRNLSMGEILYQVTLANKILKEEIHATDLTYKEMRMYKQIHKDGRDAAQDFSQKDKTIGRREMQGGASEARRMYTQIHKEGRDAAPTQQILSSNRFISNVVFMGMGEPLDNYDAVVETCKHLINEKYFGLSKHKVTVSTSGLIPEIERLGKDLPVALAISLHAADDELRSEMMPINKKYPLTELKKALLNYPVQTRHGVTFEYVMIKNKNDSLVHAKKLVKFVSGLQAKVNLIPMNAHPGIEMNAADAAVIKNFQTYLTDRGISAPVRYSRGQDVSAACGQLASKKREELALEPRKVALTRRKEFLSTRA